MALDDDLPLNRPTPRLHQPPPGRRFSALQWVFVAIAGLAAGGLLTYWWLSRAQPVTAPPPTAVAADVDTSSNRPKRQPLDLPPLGESDTFLRSLVSTLSQHPTLARFLTTDGLARASALAVVQVGDGRTPDMPLAALRPESRARIAAGGDAGAIDAASYARWDSAVAALTSINPADAAQLYVNVKPLLDEAYIELGHTDGDFDAAIVRAIERLRATPVPARAPQVVQGAGYIEHTDPALEALEPVQQQFLLVGPENQRRILTWLEQVATNLDLALE